MTTTIASRVVEFLRTNGASSIQLMSDSLGVPGNRISATISQINAGKSKESARIIGDRVEGKLYSIYSLDSYDAPQAEKKQDVCVAMPGTPAKSQRDIARDALIGYIGNELRSDFERMLAEILPTIVESAMSGMATDIRAALSGAFAKKQTVVADEIQITTTPVASNPVAAIIADAAKPEPAHIAAPVVNVVSTRTKHREKAKPAQAAESAKVVEGRNRKALVVGLHSNKQEFIRREFRDCFELRLYTPDQLRAIQECVKSGDLAFLMADFVSHKHQDILQNAGAEVVVVHGGISSLREAMTAAYVTSEDKEAA